MYIYPNNQNHRISGSTLKLIAMASMLIDHLAAFLLINFEFFTSPILPFSFVGTSLYSLCRIIGRVAFPIYCFLLVEGFRYTSDRRKYGIRLFIFALISEVPWDFVHSGKLFHSSQNVMFTLLFGYLALSAIEYFKHDRARLALSLAAIVFITFLADVDYSVAGVGLILIIYIFRSDPMLQGILGCCMIGNAWASLAFIPINLYSGDRGFMRGSFWKYAAYIFYPAHLLLLGVIRYIIFK